MTRWVLAVVVGTVSLLATGSGAATSAGAGSGRPALATVVSPELELSPPEYGPSPAAGTSPAIAATPDGWVATWLGEGGVHGARVGADGVPLDPTGVFLARNGGDSAIARGPAATVLVYQSLEAPGAAIAVPLGPGLAYAGGARLPEVPDGYYLADLSISASASGFLVVWVEETWELANVRAVRLGPGGEVLDATPIALATGLPRSRPAGAAVAPEGDGYLVVWVEHSQYLQDDTIRGQRVGADGALAPRFDVATALEAVVPSIASRDGEHLVVWSGRATWSSGALSVRGVRVAFGGGPVDATPLALSADGVEFGVPVGVSRLGPGYVVAWYTLRHEQVRATRVLDGVPLEPDGVVLAEQDGYDGSWPWPQERVAIATSGDRALAAFALVFPWPALSASVLAWDAPFARSARHDLVRPALAQHGGAAARAGGLTAVAWQEYGADGWEIRAARVAEDGTVLDRPALRVGRASPYVPGWAEAQNVAVASDGAGFLVGWEAYRADGAPEFRVAPVGLDGAVPAPGGHVVDALAPGYVSALVGGGSGYLVIGQSYGPDLATEIVALALDDAGMPAGPRTVVAAAPAAPYTRFVRPHGAGGDRGWLVVWHAWLDEPATGMDWPPGVVLAAVLDGQGRPAGAPVEVSSRAFRHQVEPRASFGSSGEGVHGPGASGGRPAYLVTWTNSERVDTPLSISGARVSPQGKVLDAPLPLVAQGDVRYDVAWDGARWLVPWIRPPAWSSAPLPPQDVHLSTVSPRGEAVAEGVVASLRSTLQTRSFAVAPGAHGRALLVDSEFDPAPEYVEYRIRARWLEAAPAAR